MAHISNPLHIAHIPRKFRAMQLACGLLPLGDPDSTTTTEGGDMDYQTYATRRQAETARQQLRGWPQSRVIALYRADHGDKWAVECETGHYLRTDGYVR